MFPISLIFSFLMPLVLISSVIALYIILLVLFSVYIPCAFVAIWLLHFVKRFSGRGSERLAASPHPSSAMRGRNIVDIYKFAFTWQWTKDPGPETEDICFVDSSKQCPRYSYQSLPITRESCMIRILELLPGRRESPIRCRMHHVSLEDNPEYEAISYHWGNPNYRLPVYVDDNSFIEVTKNLTYALQNFRRETESRALWVDAICIDQSDDAVDERSHQVSFMGEIYQKSQGCLVWLGKGPPETSQCLSATAQLLQLERELRDKNFSKDPNFMSPEEKKSYGIPYGQTPHLMGLQMILSNVWLSRIWIVQEVSLAPRAILYLGDGSIEWDAFTSAWRFANNMGLSTVESEDPFSGFAAILMARTLHDGARRTLPLLTQFRKFDATKPVDKVYALYSLLSKPLRSTWRPDYNMSIEDVYCDVAKRVLKEDRNLDLLGVPKSTQHDSDCDTISLPSWVPDWRLNSVPLSLQSLEFAPHGNSKFKAAGAYTYDMVLSDDGRLLKVDGCILHRIQFLGDIYPYSTKSVGSTAEELLQFRVRQIDDWMAAYSSWKHVAHPQSHEVYRPYDHGSTRISTEDAFWRTMVAGSTVVHDRDSPNLTTLVENAERLQESFIAFDKMATSIRKQRFLLRIIPNVASIMTFTLGKVLLADFTPFLNSLFSLMAQDPAAQDFCNSMVFAYGRRMAKADTGHIGLVPGNSAIGDRIALLKGARTPIVLREKENNWEVIGEAYVEGMMYGETWDETLSCTIWLS